MARAFPLNAAAPGPRLLALALALGLLAAATAGAAEIRVLLVPNQEAVVSSQITGRITAMPFDQGQAFQKDALLVAFDCQILEAEQEKAHLDMEAARESHQANLRLQEYGSVSELDVALSSSKLKRAQAEYLLASTKTGMCRITAPFAGRVVKRRANPHEYVTTGTPLLEVLDDATLKLHLLVPSRWATSLAPGTPFTVRIDETGRTYEARVTGLGARVNPVNQTLEVRGVIAGSHPELLAGMSGTASFDAFDRHGSDKSDR